MKQLLLKNIILMSLAILWGTAQAVDESLSFAEVLETSGNKVARCLIVDSTTGAKKQRSFCMYGTYKYKKLILTNRDNTADGKILAGSSFKTYKKGEIGKQIQEWLGSRFDIKSDPVPVIKTIITAPELKIGEPDILAKLEKKFEINQNILHYELSPGARKIFTDRQNQGELYQFARAVHVSLPVYFHANNQLESTKATLNNKDKEIGQLNAHLEQYHTLAQEVQTAQDKQIRIWIPNLMGVSPKIFWLGVVILSLVLVVALFVFHWFQNRGLNMIKKCTRITKFEMKKDLILTTNLSGNEKQVPIKEAVIKEKATVKWVKALLEARDNYWINAFDEKLGEKIIHPDKLIKKWAEIAQRLKQQAEKVDKLENELKNLSAYLGLESASQLTTQLTTQFNPLIKKITGKQLNPENNNLKQVLQELANENKEAELSTLLGLGAEKQVNVSQISTQLNPLIKQMTGQKLSQENNLKQVLVKVQKELAKLSSAKKAEPLLNGVEKIFENVESLLEEFNRLLQPKEVKVTRANIPADLSEIVGNIKNENDVGSKLLALSTEEEIQPFIADEAPEVLRDYFTQLSSFKENLFKVKQSWQDFSGYTESGELANQLEEFLKIAKDALEPFQGESVEERFSKMVKIHKANQNELNQVYHAWQKFSSETESITTVARFEEFLNLIGKEAFEAFQLQDGTVDERFKELMRTCKKDQDELNNLYQSWKDFSCEERDIYQSVARFKEFLDLIRKEAFDAFNLQEGSVDERFNNLMRTHKDDQDELKNLYQSWKDFSGEKGIIYESVNRFAEFLNLVKTEGFEKLTLKEETVDGKFEELMRNHLKTQKNWDYVNQAWATFSDEKEVLQVTRLEQFFNTVNDTFTAFKLPAKTSVDNKTVQLVTIYNEVGQREGIYEGLLFEHFYLPKPEQKTIAQLTSWQKKIIQHQQDDIRTWLKYDLLGEIIACKKAVADIKKKNDTELNQCLKVLYMDQIMKEYLENLRQEQFNTDALLYSGLKKRWLHKVFRAAALLQTYYPNHEDFKVLEAHLRIITDMLRAVFVGLPELNIQFFEPTLLAAAPKDCEVEARTESSLTKLRAVKDRVKQTKAALKSNKFIVDVETYEISDKNSPSKMVVIGYNPDAWK